MDLNYDDDWYRYFGDSTVFHCGRNGFSVHMPGDGKPSEADRIEDRSESKDPDRLGQTAGYDKN